MSEATRRRSGRKRKMSKRERRARGLSSSTSSDGTDDDGDNDSPKLQPSAALERSPSITDLALQPPVPATTVTNTLVRSQSIASVASLASLNTESDDPRRAKFDKRYKTATTSDADILSLFFLYDPFLF
jgi:hypothetical protein